MVKVLVAPFLLLFVPFVVALGGVGVVNVSGNASNVSVDYNGGIVSFVPGQNVSVNVSFNVTVPGEFRNESLSGGMNRSFAGVFENLSVWCNASTVNQTIIVNQSIVYVNGSPVNVTVCTINASMRYGETFTRNDAYCNVILHYSNGNDSVFTNGTLVNVSKTVTIAKNGNVLTVSMENYSQSVDLSFMNATTTVPVSYTCPVTIQNLSAEGNVEDTFRVCQYYFPYIADWLNLTLNKCVGNMELFRDYVNARDKVVADANQALSDCRAANGLKDGEINTLRAQVVAQQEVVSSCQDTNQAMVFVMSFLGAIIVMGVIVGFMLVHRASTEE